ncbi:MAG: transposase [Phycisphaeraceae bacterium]|nr:transposase [Phycisphaeraceae bacterium]
MQRPDGTFQKRTRRWETGPLTRYLTFSCYRRIPLLNSPKVRNDLAACLARAKEKYSFRLIAWVIMPEHVHLMLEPSKADDVPSILTSIKQPVAQRLLRSLRKSQDEALAAITTPAGEARAWQEGGGFDRNVRTLDELRREIVYIHHNPVERGLVSTPIEWEWSSARWYAELRADGAGWGGRIPIDKSEVDWGLQNP